MPLVESELKRIARRYMPREAQGHTLQTTALVNEAYIKLIDQRNIQWQNRSHFFALASTIMRRILLNHARTIARGKRGGGITRVELEEANHALPEMSVDLIALDEALKRLAEVDALKSKIVELRFFGGLTVEETAEVLKIAPVTVMKHWRLAKSWLGREIRGASEK